MSRGGRRGKNLWKSKQPMDIDFESSLHCVAKLSWEHSCGDMGFIIQKEILNLIVWKHRIKGEELFQNLILLAIVHVLYFAQKLADGDISFKNTHRLQHTRCLIFLQWSHSSPIQAPLAYWEHLISLLEKFFHWILLPQWTCSGSRLNLYWHFSAYKRPQMLMTDFLCRLILRYSHLGEMVLSPYNDQDPALLLFFGRAPHSCNLETDDRADQGQSPPHHHPSPTQDHSH